MMWSQLLKIFGLLRHVFAFPLLHDLLFTSTTYICVNSVNSAVLYLISTSTAASASTAANPSSSVAATIPATTDATSSSDTNSSGPTSAATTFCSTQGGVAVPFSFAFPIARLAASAVATSNPTPPAASSPPPADATILPAHPTDASLFVMRLA